MLEQPEPVTIRLWTAKGEVQVWHRAVSLRYDLYRGIRNVKLLDSGEIRKLRDVCIIEINNMEVYL